ncbi:T9SS type B sorting domain-containing protein [Seonamhaeicola sp.]|uniref:T9SS type B sorting domain-containing protein n=1 Tax=Seonamhaeicola sp. TaxID=1912245 RepID=UPI0026190A01|nr:T9SS type B sorting domain-containing protein [Seonamhaeicola sp.]
MRRIGTEKIIFIGFLFGCFLIQGSYAQLGFCTGNSGDPIFTETFGTGTTNNPLPSGTTTYSYSSGTPSDGFYTVSNGTFGSWSDWHEIPDHTVGDTNGKLLIVNAALAAGEFYRTSIIGLCENTTYEFSAWVINLLIGNTICGAGAIPINVRFEIWDSTDTVLLASGDTGNITETFTPNWQEYGLVFQTSPGQTAVILKMRNNGTGGCGNDLAIDDIEFKTCGDLTTVTDGLGNSSAIICSTDTPYSTTLTANPDGIVFANHFYQWQQSTDGTTWTDIAGETNQSFSVTGITNTMYYRTKVTETANTINNPQCNTLSDVYQITVNTVVTPTFTQVPAICSGDTLSPLPTTSNEGITGTWSPALDNTMTTTYTFTPDAGQCAVTQTMTITVNPIVTPTFNQVADICSGDTLSPLPITSNEGITGAWSPALDNTATTTYIFTPDVGQCAITQTMTITVTPTVIPTFTQVSAICNGDTLSPLPTTSNEGVTGTWSPALDNTATTIYTFTPDAGQCTVTQTMTITVNPIVTPTFTQVPAICSGDTLSPLPTTSNEGVTGAWSPALDNTMTTTYTFTPDPGFCPTTVTMTIVVNDNPNVILQNEYFLCFNTGGGVAIPLSINTGLPTGTFNFTWFLGGVIIPGANLGSYAPTQAGIYEVVVQNAMTLCETRAATTVTALLEPVFEANVTSEVFLENQIIEVTTISAGIFEYSLDNGPWQESPIFTNVSIGAHTVTVRDTRGCIESSQTVIVIGYPKYFTPNDDGSHDTWNIIAPANPNTFLATAEIFIFDRYGKLLKQLNPNGAGWNGIYNGVKMPTDDYWFVIAYNEPNTNERKQFRAHFTLKR